MAKIKTISGMICLLLSLSSQAESLQEAFSSAVENSHRIKSAQADTSATEQQLQAAQGQRLPKLDVSSGYTQFSETPAAIAHFSGMTSTFNTSQAGSVKAQAIASLPVFTSGRIRHSIDAAKASLEAAQSNEMTSVLNIKMQVAEAYVAVLHAESALKIAQSHVESLSAHEKDVKNMFDQGIVARNDWLAAQVERVNAEQSVMQMNNQLDIAKARYNRLLDRNLADEVSLAHPFPEALKSNLADLSDKALKQRPELIMLTQQIEALKQQAQSVKAGTLPQVSVNGGYQYQENRYQAFQGMWMANATVEWNLFNGSTSHNSDAINRQALSLKEQRDDLSSQISLQVRQAWLDIQEAEKRVTVTQQAIEQADENMKVTTDRYQQGLSINTDVLKAEDLRNSAKNNLNNAQYDALLASLRLQWAVGIL